MKSIYYIFLLSLFFSSCNTKNIEQVKILGNKQFSKKQWLTATQEERGQMTYSLLKGINLSNLTPNDILELLGKPTAYYEYDEFPAYIIGEQSIESDLEHSYILAFTVNRKTNNIDQFIIHPWPSSH